MKIVSKFKDYYDHISHIYGQDTKVVYERHLINDLSISYFNDSNIIKKDDLDIDGLSYPSNCKYDFRWLIVCGKRFLLFRKGEYPKTQIWTSYKNSSEVRNYVSLTRSKEDESSRYRKYRSSEWFYRRRKRPEYFMGEFCQKNLDFCIKHKCPIIVIEGNRFTTDSPILGDIINFVSMYPAEQIYQDISYFMLNQINGSPDIDPPVLLDDKFKIDYHGFNKVSFRPTMRKIGE
jgi:hypothetical protein